MKIDYLLNSKGEINFTKMNKNIQLPILLVEKDLRQEGHPAVKFLLQTLKF